MVQVTKRHDKHKLKLSPHTKQILSNLSVSQCPHDITDQTKHEIHTDWLQCALFPCKYSILPSVCTPPASSARSLFQTGFRVSNSRATNWSKIRKESLEQILLTSNCACGKLGPAVYLEPGLDDIERAHEGRRHHTCAQSPTNHLQSPKHWDHRPKCTGEGEFQRKSYHYHLPAEAPATAWQRRPRAVVGPWWWWRFCDDEDTDGGAGAGEVATSPGIWLDPSSPPRSAPRPRVAAVARGLGRYSRSLSNASLRERITDAARRRQLRRPIASPAAGPRTGRLGLGFGIWWGGRGGHWDGAGYM